MTVEIVCQKLKLFQTARSIMVDMFLTEHVFEIHGDRSPQTNGNT